MTNEYMPLIISTSTILIGFLGFFIHLSNRMDKMNETTNAKVDAGFKSVNDRIDKINDRIDKVKDEVNKLVSRIDRIESRLEFSNKIVYVQQEEPKEN